MYIPGDYYLLCDICGFRIRRSEARKTWDGLMVCSKDWEPRHPQDFVRAIQERNNALDARPEGTDTFVTDNQITPESL